MSYEKESLLKTYFHPLQALGFVNGFFKLNFEVPQTNSLYSSDCLYPINAKVNSDMPNNTIDESNRMKTPDIIINNLKNLSLTTHENKENLYDKQSYSSNLATYNLKTYSKPSYSGISNNVEKKEEKKRSLSPNNELKNKFSMMSGSATFDNQTSEPIFIQTKKNDFTNLYDNENLEARFHSSQAQEQKRQMMIGNNNNNNNNNAQMSTSQTSISENETPIMNDLSHKSQCPICFKFYPTPVIVYHASECSN